MALYGKIKAKLGGKPFCTMVVLAAALWLFRRKFTLTDARAAEISAQLYADNKGV